MNNSNQSFEQMKKEFEDLIALEVSKEQNPEFASKITKEYIDYYFLHSDEAINKMKKLIGKYNKENILSFLGENSFPQDYVHMSLGHSIGEYSIMPMLDNGGGIYPPDLEIGYIIKDPEFWGQEETMDETKLRWKYHCLIFYSWLSIVWMEIEGHNSNIIVKTTENNSVTSFYLNDFQFDSNSNFDLKPDWKTAIENHNLKSIKIEDLVANIKKYIDKNTR